MYVGDDFSPSDVGETELYTFNYAAILASGETITSAVWSCAPVSGVDGDSASRLSGAPVYSASATQQKVIGMLAGVKYRLQSIVTTSLGQSLSLWSHVQCNAPA